MDKFKNILSSYELLAALKKLKRAGWLRKNVPAPESVAEHSFGTAMLGFLLAMEYYPALDAARVLQMGLVHDLGEAVVGDILPWHKLKMAGIDEAERAGALKFAENFKALGALTHLYDEYYRQETPESKFVYLIDKLEMLLQAYEYEQEYGLDLENFFDNKRQGLFEGKLQDILDELLSVRSCGKLKMENGGCCPLKS